VVDRERVLPLTGAYNFRDLGGYPTSTGRRTRWGRLFRSDTLHELTDGDLEVLRDVGLASVIDLRTPTEVERTGRGLLAGEPVRYVNLSVLGEEVRDVGEARAAPTIADFVDVADRYLSYLDGTAALMAAVGLLTDESSYPVVFHCAAGKDRTGVLAALVLDTLGVDRQAIVDDYALTATRMDLILGRLRRDPLYGDRVDDLPASVFAVEAETMERFLIGIDQRYGGARGWALDAGVPEDALDLLPDLLLEPVDAD
jgi:protein-tyrosine phosphatase